MSQCGEFRWREEGKKCIHRSRALGQIPKSSPVTQPPSRKGRNNSFLLLLPFSPSSFLLSFFHSLILSNSLHSPLHFRTTHRTSVRTPSTSKVPALVRGQGLVDTWYGSRTGRKCIIATRVNANTNNKRRDLVRLHQTKQRDNHDLHKSRLWMTFFCQKPQLNYSIDYTIFVQ